MIQREQLAARILERSTFDRVRVSDQQLAALEDPLALSQWRQAFAGTECLTVMDKPPRTKYIVSWAYPVTRSEMAREYVRWCYELADMPLPGQVRADCPGYQQKDPLYCAPVRRRNLAYVDIRSAYWQIVQPYNVDPLVAIGPGKVWQGRTPWKDPAVIEADREIRHRAIGTLMSSGVEVWRRGVRQTLPVAGRFSNPSVAVLARGTLTAICRTARENFPIHAWLTDAAILDARAADELIGWLGATWGVEARTVALGLGTVWNVSSYRVGRKASLDVVNAPKGKRYPAATDETECLIDPGTLWRWRQDALTD